MVTRAAVAKALELTVPALANLTLHPVLKAVLPGPSRLVLFPGGPAGASVTLNPAGNPPPRWPARLACACSSESSPGGLCSPGPDERPGSPAGWCLSGLAHAEQHPGHLLGEPVLTLGVTRPGPDPVVAAGPAPGPAAPTCTRSASQARSAPCCCAPPAPRGPGTGPPLSAAHFRSDRSPWQDAQPPRVRATTDRRRVHLRDPPWPLTGRPSPRSPTATTWVPRDDPRAPRPPGGR